MADWYDKDDIKAGKSRAAKAALIEGYVLPLYPLNQSGGHGRRGHGPLNQSGGHGRQASTTRIQSLKRSIDKVLN